MREDMDMYRCVIMRGGTSKGIFIMKKELPSEPAKRDAIILSIYGSPDVRQIDGLGGADVLTSKLAIISPSSRSDADVDYTFGQVSFETDFIDYGGNCGNISAAVGPFAIDEGLVSAKEPVTAVRIHMTNSGSILTAEVPVKNGKAAVAGDCAIDGVPGTGARIDMDWSGTAGSAGRGLLPTGNVRDTIVLDAKSYEISLVDMGNPLVFIRAESLGLEGTETPQQIEANKPLMGEIEKIRSRAAVMCGLIAEGEKAAEKTPYIPFFAVISPAKDYRAANNVAVNAADIDFVSRLLFMLKTHKTYPITGTVCSGAAARIPGSIVWEAINEANRNAPEVRIGHPGGVISVGVEAETTGNDAVINKVKVFRTARRIMEGYVFVKK